MKRLLEQFGRRDAHPAVQFIKYGLAGVIATSVDVALFYICAIYFLPCLTPDDPAARLFGLHPGPIAEGLRSSNYVWGKSICFLVANYVAYKVNVAWVFTPGRHSKAVEFGLFYAVSGTTFALGTSLGWMLIKWGGLPTTYAYLANGIAALLINFVCRKFIVFKG